MVQHDHRGLKRTIIDAYRLKLPTATNPTTTNNHICMLSEVAFRNAIAR
jgi:hypothetical protein